MSLAVSFLARYDALDRGLVQAGFPPTSAWWRSELGRFVSAGRRRWVIRVGHRGGKSSTLARLAVAWALWGTWAVPPGDVGVVAFVSIDRTEASARLRTIAKVLDVIGVDYEQRAKEIELKDKPVCFRVATCSITSVGFTSILVVGDEVARWEARDTAANPAKEVLGSLAPTMATQPHAFMVLSSSPWSLDDHHAELFDAGEAAHQCVSFAPTWIANPTISEAQTHELEPDDRVWAREYAAVPSMAVSSAFDATEVLGCFGRQPSGRQHLGGWIAIDPSSLRGDGFGYAAGYTTDRDELVVQGCGEFPPGTPLRTIVNLLTAAAHALNTSTIFSDQREEASLRLLFEEAGITLATYTWSDKSKEEAVLQLKRYMHERRLVVTAEPNGAGKLKSELLAVRARAMPSGRFVYGLTGKDVASCLVTLAHAATRGDVQFYGVNPLIEALERNRLETGSPTPGFIPPIGRAVGYY